MHGIKYWLFAGVSAFSVAGAASAAETPQKAPEASEAVEEIVVTALKRSSTLQTTPVSVSAVGGDSLQKMGATGVADYFRAVPGVNLNQGMGAQSRISVRGIVGTGEATTGMYYDETPVTGPSATTQDAGNNSADLNLFDVQRVEVLRGPQGTLYGGSSMSGAIRVIFNKPNSTKYEASVEAQGSTVKDGGDGYFVKGMGNIPIIQDKLAVRLVGYTEDRPGWVDNVRLGEKDANKTHSEGYRAMLDFTPTDDLSFTLTHIKQSTDTKDTPGYYTDIGLYKTNAMAKTPVNSEMELTNVTGKWETALGDLTASSSYYRYDLSRDVDFSPQYAPYVHNAFGVVGHQPSTLGSWNHEVRFSSKSGGPLDWTVGVYNELRKDHTDSLTLMTDPATGEPYSPYRYVSGRYLNNHLKQMSEFGEASYSPEYVPGLTVTVGARHYDYSKVTDGASNHPDLFTGSAGRPYASVKGKASGWVYKFNASYKINSDAMAYATASEGFRPGGANNVPDIDPRLAVYTPDKLWTYEAGLKTTWLNGKLTANGAVYLTDWSDRQTTSFTANGLYAFSVNVGDARLKGFEVELVARPITGLSLTGSLAYVEGKVTSVGEKAPLLVTSDKKGDKLTNAPDWTGSLSANYVWPIAGSINGLLRADYAYTGEMAIYQPGYIYFTKYGSFSTVNLRAGVEGENWGAYLFVSNATNAEGVMSKLSGPGYSNQSYGITPRTFGANVRHSF